MTEVSSFRDKYIRLKRNHLEVKRKTEPSEKVKMEKTTNVRQIPRWKIVRIKTTPIIVREKLF